MREYASAPSHTYYIKHSFQLYLRLYKRTFDLLFSFCVLILFSPVFLIISLAIKYSSTGPIFYSSLRMGKGGKPFKCWKFRTMYKDAEQKLARLLETDPALKKEWDTFFKLKNDPRVTNLGKWLRKTSLDELPQFWNVFKGELSIVGPRPFLIDEIEQCVCEKKEKILSVKPGITGIWQTSGRNLRTFQERLYLDERYVEKRSFLYDIYLIGKTIFVLIFPKGAY